MKKIIFLFFVASLRLYCQDVENTSYINQSNEKALRLEITIPADMETTWKLFSTDEGLMKWIAPLAHIELRTGGYIVTNYDKSKALSDSSSIRLPIINYIKNELLVLKVVLNNHFAEDVRLTSDNLQEIIQFVKIDESHTKIISSMVGFGKGNHWDSTYDFFLKGNVWTFKQIIKIFK